MIFGIFECNTINVSYSIVHKKNLHKPRKKHQGKRRKMKILLVQIFTVNSFRIWYFYRIFAYTQKLKYFTYCKKLKMRGSRWDFNIYLAFISFIHFPAFGFQLYTQPKLFQRLTKKKIQCLNENKLSKLKSWRLKIAWKFLTSVKWLLFKKSCYLTQYFFLAWVW